MTTSVSPRAGGTLNPTRQQLDELDALLQRMLELPVHPLDKTDQAKFEGPAETPPVLSPQPPTQARPSGEQAPPSLRPTTPPFSYTVVETASPRPLPPASGFEPKSPLLKPRLVPVTPQPQAPSAVPDAGTNEGETWVPLRSTWQPSASTWPPLAESWQQAKAGTPSRIASPPSANISAEPPQPHVPSETAAAAEKPRLTPNPELSTQNSETKTRSEPMLRLPAVDAPVSAPWPLMPLVWFNQGFDACLTPLGAPGRWLCGRGRVVLGFIGLTCLAAAAAIAVNAGMGWSR